jgi:hypothetical protein
MGPEFGGTMKELTERVRALRTKVALEGVFEKKPGVVDLKKSHGLVLIGFTKV